MGKLWLVHVYKVDENKVAEIITNNLDRSTRTIAGLYGGGILNCFFKAMKNSLQIKKFLGTSENVVKLQIYIELITYLLFTLINRTVAKKAKSFSKLAIKNRICPVYCQGLNYVCNQVDGGAKK